MKNLTSQKVNRVLIALLMVVALCVPFLTSNSYRLYFFTQVAFYIIAASGLDILFGYAGMISNAYVQPNSFNYVIMCIFGGVNSIFGPVIGALVQQLISESLASATAWRDIIFGGVTMLLIAFLPGGIVGSLRKLEDRLLRRLNGANKAEGGDAR